MNNLRFNDGEEFDTSGELRKEHRADGWYVVGKGMLIPLDTEALCDKYIAKARGEAKEKLKMYVLRRDGSPVIEVGSNKHRPFTKEGLDEALDKVNEYAVELRRQWDDQDWFPCGFVNLKVPIGSTLDVFLKENNEKPDDPNQSCVYKNITSMRGYDGENRTLFLNIPHQKGDALASQSMRYKQRVYEKFQTLLAFLSVVAGLETVID